MPATIDAAYCEKAAVSSSIRVVVGTCSCPLRRLFWVLARSPTTGVCSSSGAFFWIGSWISLGVLKRDLSTTLFGISKEKKRLTAARPARDRPRVLRTTGELQIVRRTSVFCGRVCRGQEECLGAWAHTRAPSRKKKCRTKWMPFIDDARGDERETTRVSSLRGSSRGSGHESTIRVAPTDTGF